MTLPAQPSQNAGRRSPGAEPSTRATSAGAFSGEDRWRHVVQDSPLATIILAQGMRVEFVNAEAERLFGWSASELVGRRKLPMVPPDRQAEVDEIRRVLRTGGTVENLETIRTCKDGRSVDVAIYAAPFGASMRDGVAVRFIDITERRRSEEAARDQLARRSVLADFLSASTSVRDERELLGLLSHRAASALDGICAVYFLTPDGRNFEVLAISGDDATTIERLGAMFGRQPWRPNEGIVGETLTTGNGVFRAYMNASERAAYLDSLPADRREDMARLDLRAAVTLPLSVGGSLVGVLALLRFGENAHPVTDRDRAFLEELVGRANIALARLELLAQREREARQSFVVAEFLRTIAEAGADDGVVLGQMARAIVQQVGDWCAVKLLTTDRAQLETIAIASRHSDAGVPRMRPDFPAVSCDDPLDRDVIATGRTVAARVGSEDLRATANPGLDGADGHLPFAWRLAAPLTVRDRLEGDVLILRESDSGPFSEPDRHFAEDLVARAGLALDRQRLEMDLTRTSETLGTILNASPVAIWATDNRMRVMYWNPAAERLYGWTAEEVEGRLPPFDIPADDENSVRSLFERVKAGETVEVEARRATSTGRLIDVRLLNAPIRDETGSFRGLLGVHEDITERKRLEAELMQAQKMEVVGRLAGGVAHDFNNILTAILGYSELARSMADEPELVSLLETVKAAAQRAAGLTQQLLAFSRRQVLQPRIIDVNVVVQEMEPMLRRLIGEDIDLVVAVADSASCVLVDRTQLEQVILNLAVNARDAMPNGGRLILRTETASFGATHHDGDLRPGEYVMISVADTGVGMDRETQAHIFEPFFTTKEVGKGTGLGLATTYGIVRQSGGHIWLYSEPKRGTTFKLYFPRVVAPEATVPPVLAAGREARSGRLLVVEDQPELRRLAVAILTQAGFDVLAAHDAASALVVAADAGELDLLVTDVIMPGGSGVRLARRLRALRPGLPVLFMSGHPEDMTDVAGAMGRRFLAKPFGPEAMLAAVDEALASGRRTPSA
jgi:PAS domain S-box-containing protein